MDVHHILYTKDVWRSQAVTRTLRHHPMLKVPLDPTIHKRLHRKIPFVPILDHFTAQAVVRDWEPVNGDYIASVENLMRPLSI